MAHFAKLGINGKVLSVEVVADADTQGADGTELESVGVDFLNKVCENKLEPYIAKCFDELADYSNAFKNAMVMKREVIANKGIWVAKKRYMSVSYTHLTLPTKA